MNVRNVWIELVPGAYRLQVDLTHGAARAPHKSVVLRGGPLNGEPVALPAQAISLVVFEDGVFHRYSLAASGGELGEHAPLGYTGTVPVEVAGFTPARGASAEWTLPADAPFAR